MGSALFGEGEGRVCPPFHLPGAVSGEYGRESCSMDPMSVLPSTAGTQEEGGLLHAPSPTLPPHCFLPLLRYVTFVWFCVYVWGERRECVVSERIISSHRVSNTNLS